MAGAAAATAWSNAYDGDGGGSGSNEERDRHVTYKYIHSVDEKVQLDLTNAKRATLDATELTELRDKLTYRRKCLATIQTKISNGMLEWIQEYVKRERFDWNVEMQVSFKKDNAVRNDMKTMLECDSRALSSSISSEDDIKQNGNWKHVIIETVPSLVNTIVVKSSGDCIFTVESRIECQVKNEDTIVRVLCVRLRQREHDGMYYASYEGYKAYEFFTDGGTYDTLMSTDPKYINQLQNMCDFGIVTINCKHANGKYIFFDMDLAVTMPGRYYGIIEQNKKFRGKLRELAEDTPFITLTEYSVDELTLEKKLFERKFETPQLFLAWSVKYTKEPHINIQKFSPSLLSLTTLLRVLDALETEDIAFV